MRYFLYSLLFAIISFLGFLGYKTWLAKSQQPASFNTELAAVPPDATEHLAQAVACATNSYSDRIDSVELKKLRILIDTTFPRCRKELHQTVIDGFSLLYKWRGRDTALAPIVLLAHLDVVPVEATALADWTQPPYSGKVADGFLWGRGTLDDKVSAFGILEAAEMLLKQGFQPKQTIYLAFGHDEEVGGEKGAMAIVRYLDSVEQVRHATVLDEGMVVLENALPGLKPPLALVGIAEKGYATLQLKVKSTGGHSSMPPEHTAIGLLSEAIVALEKHPCAARFTLPVKQLFDYAGPEMDFPLNAVMANRWLTEPLLKWQLLKKAQTAALLRTTTAPTMCQAGIKDNVLAHEAIAIINFRIIPGETVDSVLAHVKRTLRGIDVEVSLKGIPNNPTAVTPTNTAAFERLGGIIRGIFKNAVVAPALVLGATDSRHYAAIADNTFRFLPILLTNDDLGRIHGVDERISLENYHRSIVFYYNLLKFW